MTWNLGRLYILFRSQADQPVKFHRSILCCKGAPSEEPQPKKYFGDLDPRVFQAVYWKLLESMSMVKEQLEQIGVEQDKLIELEIDVEAPLKTSIFPLLAEASEKKVTYHFTGNCWFEKLRRKKLSLSEKR